MLDSSMTSSCNNNNNNNINISNSSHQNEENEAYKNHMMRRYSGTEEDDEDHQNNRLLQQQQQHGLVESNPNEEEEEEEEEDEEEEEELGMAPVSPMMNWRTNDMTTTAAAAASSSSLSSPCPQVWSTTPKWNTSPWMIGSSSISNNNCCPLLLLSLPVDALHSIASFCNGQEWSNFGLASHSANRACREVFKRVKMHGFRCAAEVIAAWERGQLSDARELCALYLHSQVPIHPRVLGHAYATLEWRMSVEAPQPLDAFYAHRDEARQTEQYYHKGLTYLEEKCLFHKSLDKVDRRRRLRHPKLDLSVHRHLLDQHLLHHPGASEESPKKPFCLSSDFFHPFIPCHPEVLPDVSLEVFSCTSLPTQSTTMKIMFRYQKKLAGLLHRYDTQGFDECLLDFWDEFFPRTKGVMMYDKATPVPRLSHLHEFLTRPCPLSWGSIQCEIERIKTYRPKKIKGRFFPTYEYRLFLRDRRHGQPESQVQDEHLPPRHDTVIMVARHSKRGVNNYYLYMPSSTDAQSHFASVNAKTNPPLPPVASLPQHELGRLQSNFIGTEFQIFLPTHKTLPPPKQHTTTTTQKTWRRLPRLTKWTTSDGRTSRRAIADSTSIGNLDELECGAITYTANLLGNRPRIMDVCIPKVHAGEHVMSNVWRHHVERIRQETNTTDSMLTRFKQIQQQQQQQVTDDVPRDDAEALGLTTLQNRPPWWNVELGAFVLNFGGRVSVASVKNFQLCDKHNQEHIMLQFGRIQGRHSFTMDFQYPLSPVQAFAIAISSLQSKISFG